MNRRSYVNRQTMRRDRECVWCHRTGQDVLERSPADGPMGARHECVNTRRCMKERTILAAAARLVRAAELERAAELAIAGAHTCIPASCLTHRQRVFWQSAERRWVHLDCFPCERNIFRAAPVPTAAPLAGLVAAFDAEAARMRATMGDQAPVRDDGALFGAEAVVGLGQLPGQRSLFGDLA
jgi:hypothetical protein